MGKTSRRRGGGPKKKQQEEVEDPNAWREKQVDTSTCNNNALRQ